MVARAWTDAGYRALMLEDGTKAAEAMNIPTQGALMGVQHAPSMVTVITQIAPVSGLAASDGNKTSQRANVTTPTWMRYRNVVARRPKFGSSAVGPFDKSQGITPVRTR